MPSNVHVAQNTSTQTVTTTTELAIAQLVPYQVANPGGTGVQLSGEINGTAGTGTTAIVARIRQGNGITGSVVGGPVTVSVTAGNTFEVNPTAEDVNNLLGDIGYSLTIQQTGASGNGSVNLANLTAQDATLFE
jgi:hypothetical protein